MKNPNPDSENNNFGAKVKHHPSIKHKKVNIHWIIKVFAGLIAVITILSAFRIEAIKFQYVDDILFVFLFGNYIKYLIYAWIIFISICIIFSQFFLVHLFKGKYGILSLLIITIFALGVASQFSVMGTNETARNELGGLINKYASEFWDNVGSNNLSPGFLGDSMGGFIGLLYVVVMAGIFHPVEQAFSIIVLILLYLIAISYTFTRKTIYLYILGYKWIVHRVITNKEEHKHQKENSVIEQNYKVTKLKRKAEKNLTTNLTPPDQETLVKPQSKTSFFTKKFNFKKNRIDNDNKAEKPARNYNIHNTIQLQTPKKELSRKELIQKHKDNYNKYFNIPDNLNRMRRRRPEEQTQEEPLISDRVGQGMFQEQERTQKIKRDLSRTQEKKIARFDKDFIDINPFGLKKEERNQYYKKNNRDTDEIKVKRLTGYAKDASSEYVDLDSLNKVDGDTKK